MFCARRASAPNRLMFLPWMSPLLTSASDSVLLMLLPMAVHMPLPLPFWPPQLATVYCPMAVAA